MTPRAFRSVRTVVLFAAFYGVIGCSGMDRMSRNVDMASEHVNPQKPIYEGKLQSSKKVGSLIAMQFTDGHSFEVVECPSNLVPGDVVRIYKLEKGYVAHLWKSNDAPPIPPNVLKSQPPAPPIPPSNK